MKAFKHCQDMISASKFAVSFLMHLLKDLVKTMTNSYSNRHDICGVKLQEIYLHVGNNPHFDV